MKHLEIDVTEGKEAAFVAKGCADEIQKEWHGLTPRWKEAALKDLRTLEPIDKLYTGHIDDQLVAVLTTGPFPLKNAHPKPVVRMVNTMVVKWQRRRIGTALWDYACRREVGLRTGWLLRSYELGGWVRYVTAKQLTNTPPEYWSFDINQLASWQDKVAMDARAVAALKGEIEPW